MIDGLPMRSVVKMPKNATMVFLYQLPLEGRADLDGWAVAEEYGQRGRQFQREFDVLAWVMDASEGEGRCAEGEMEWVDVAVYAGRDLASVSTTPTHAVVTLGYQLPFDERTSFDGDEEAKSLNNVAERFLEQFDVAAYLLGVEGGRDRVWSDVENRWFEVELRY